MNWHVEIVRLEGVSHVSKGLQGVTPASLLKAKRHSRFAVFLQPTKKGANKTLHAKSSAPQSVAEYVFVANLSEALGAPPVPFGDVVQGRNQTEDVIAVVAAVAQQESVLGGSTTTYQAHVLVHLVGVERGGRGKGREREHQLLLLQLYYIYITVMQVY